MKNISYNMGKLSARKLVYIAAISLWVMQAYLSNSYYSVEYGYKPILAIKIIAIPIFLFELIFFSQRLTLKKGMFFSLFFVTVFIATYANGTLFSTSNFVISCIIIFASKDIDFKELCKYIFWNELIWSIIIIGSAQIGIITNYISIYDGRRRESLGATYPGFFPIHYINIFFCCLYVYLSNKEELRKRWYVLILLVIGSVFFYRKTDVRQTFYITMVAFVIYVCVMMYIGTKFMKNRWIKRISMAMFPILCIITYYASYKFSWGNPIMWQLNNWLSGRLQYNRIALNRYGLHLLGSKVEYNMGTLTNNYSDYFYIDSGYIEIGIRYGVVLLILLVCLYMYLIKRAMEQNDFVLFLWLVLLSIYNMMNNMMFSITTNASILAIWAVWNSTYNFRKHRIKIRI